MSLKLKPAVGLLALARIVGLTELSFGLVSRESDWARTGAIVIKVLIRKRSQSFRMVLLYNVSRRSIISNQDAANFIPLSRG